MHKNQLMDYKNYESFTFEDVEKLMWLCLKYSPRRLKDKCFFRDTHWCSGGKAKFYNYEISQDEYICGRFRVVRNFLAYTDEWIEKEGGK